MNTDRLAHVQELVRTGHSPAIAAVLADADENRSLVLYALSTSLVIDEKDFRALLSKLWPDRDLDAAVDAVRTLPLVRHEAQGMRLTETVRSTLAARFRDVEPRAFARAHEVLCAMEESRELAASPHETWFIRGRIAFYLAGLDPERSIRQFEASFRGDAPTLDRRTARMWLTSLVLDQEPLLSGYVRELAFYRGFRLYVSGQRDEAVTHFQTVLAEGVRDDVPSAIASHLLGVLTMRRDVAQAIELYRQSIQVSERIGLQRHGVMARNSVVWAQIRLATSVAPADRKQLLAGVVREAERNLEFASAAGDDDLRQWCAYTNASVKWLVLTDLRENPEAGRPYLDEVVVTLRETARHSLKSRDVETATLAVNDAACARRDVGDYSGALEEIGWILNRLERVYVPLTALRRLGKTTGSVLKLATGKQTDARAHALLDEITARQEATFDSPEEALPDADARLAAAA